MFSCDQIRSTVQVFDGCCVESVPLVKLSLNTRDRNGDVRGSSFQVLVVVARKTADTQFIFNVTYASVGKICLRKDYLSMGGSRGGPGGPPPFLAEVVGFLT